MLSEKLASVLETIRNPKMKAELLASVPKPLVVAQCGPGRFHPKLAISPLRWSIETSKLLQVDIGFQYRCADLSRLPIVLATAIDVEPTNAVIYADMSDDKALEYGGEDSKVMLILRDEHLDRTYREVPSDTPEAELAQLRGTFPTELRSEDGKSIWFSRLKETDPKVASPYEHTYAAWIPGDPWQCLFSIIVFGVDFERTRELVKEHMKGSRSVAWT